MSDNDYILKVAKNIKRIRVAKNLTQLQLAKRLGVSRSYICQLEYGIKLREQTLQKIATALEVEIYELLQE